MLVAFSTSVSASRRNAGEPLPLIARDAADILNLGVAERFKNEGA